MERIKYLDLVGEIDASHLFSIVARKHDSTIGVANHGSHIDWNVVFGCLLVSQSNVDPVLSDHISCVLNVVQRLRTQSIVDLRDIEVGRRASVAVVRPPHLNVDINVSKKLRHIDMVEIRVIESNLDAACVVYNARIAFLPIPFNERGVLQRVGSWYYGHKERRPTDVVAIAFNRQDAVTR